MPFSLPGRLVGLEYLASDADPEYAKLAESYQDDIDFAFFVANFGWTRDDYLDITPRQKAFIMKAFEDRVVRDTNLQNMAFGNALANLYRKKHAPAIPLWQKPSAPADIERARANIEVVLEMEKRDGKGWIDKIYKANRLSRTRREAAK